MGKSLNDVLKGIKVAQESSPYEAPKSAEDILQQKSPKSLPVEVPDVDVTPDDKTKGTRLDFSYLYKEPSEDAIPYDPNSGALTNIGRFALNNLVQSPPIPGVAGTVGLVRKAAQYAPEAESLAKALSSTWGKAVSKAAAPVGQVTGPPMDVVKALQQQSSRAIDAADKAKKIRLDSIFGRLRKK